MNGTYKRINIDHPVGALKTQLAKLLLSVDRIGWLTGSTTGRFDVRRTSRMLAGSERVFKSRTETSATTTAVSIIIDLSSSMMHGGDYSNYEDGFDASVTRIGVASQCAYAIATAVERSNCDVEVVGFTGRSTKVSAGNAKGMNDMCGGTESGVGGSRYTEAELLEIKPFNEKTGQRRKAFEFMYYGVQGCTPDYHAVRTVTEQMTQHASHRKVVIVLTDGMGDYEEMREFAEFSEKMYKVPVLGIGIQTSPSEMKCAYRKYVCVSNLQELSEVAIKSLIKQIEGQPLAAVQ